MPGLAFNPDNDIPDLSGKVIFITGGKLSCVDLFLFSLTASRNGWFGCSVSRPDSQAFSDANLYQRSERDKRRENHQGNCRDWVKHACIIRRM